jgi:ribulose-5-phosphate 4-epimerase/fuculose-1-phosphate aldolase
MMRSFQNATNSLVNWVNKFRSDTKKPQNYLVPVSIRQSFVEAVQYASTKPFGLAPLAEASFRHADNYLLTTPPSAQLAKFSLDDCGVFFFNTMVSVNGAYSPIHFAWHKRIYQVSTARAVLLCHPLNAFTLWQKGLRPNFSGLPGFEEKTGGYAIFNMESAKDTIASHRLLMVPEAGLFSYADHLYQAISQVEIFEWVCALNLKSF